MALGFNRGLTLAVRLMASLRYIAVLGILCFTLSGEASAQDFKRSEKQMVTGGMLDKSAKLDSLARYEQRLQRAREQDRVDEFGNIIPRDPLFSDSSSLSKVCITGAILPGYGQIYNKQYWQLPILYGTMGASIGMWAHYGSQHRPLKRQYEDMLLNGMERTEELNSLQRRMIRANTNKQIFMATTAISYIYFLGDAALNYSTNEVSSVKKATTLSLICPGAGQIYNKS